MFKKKQLLSSLIVRSPRHPSKSKLYDQRLPSPTRIKSSGRLATSAFRYPRNVSTTILRVLKDRTMNLSTQAMNQSSMHKSLILRRNVGCSGSSVDPQLREVEDPDCHMAHHHEEALQIFIMKFTSLSNHFHRMEYEK
uniref:AlNc14C11G1325 protein n=1 Tax=Albugo laibachii Nc14 TaxID=890382 RepID=F0W2U5_9STRA|nr:AlNc14C11G1325 [Albugo laibachii Nc14]|eukprot:CCA15381.1 AlNc14C11G1325 [Albugo laibachii Nc14]